MRGHMTQATKFNITLDTSVSKKGSAGPTGLVPVFVPLPGFGFWRAGAGGGRPCGKGNITRMYRRIP